MIRLSHSNEYRISPGRIGRVKYLLALATLLIVVGDASAELPWRTRSFPAVGRADIVVQYHPHNEADLPKLTRLVEQGRERFFALADTTFPVTIHVLAASTGLEFARLTRGMIPDWGAAVAIPEERLIIVALNAPGKPLEEAVPHEVSHVLLGVLAQHGRVPRWFDEGLAMYLAGEWTLYNSIRLARGALAGNLVPLPRIDNMLTFHQDQAWLAYTESFAAVTWLAQRIGRVELGRLLRSLDTMPFEQALVVNNGIRTSAFEEDWLQRAGTRYALVGLADDMWIWSLLIPGLFFLALLVRWWHNRRTYERWRHEDDDDDEPDEPLDERIAETY